MMSRTLTVSADDIGLSIHNTDTIIEAIDAGNITSVSILPNGNAFTYAVDMLRTRANLRVAAHLNLTEGKSLTNAPLLTDSAGLFRYSTPRLGFAYFFASRAKKKELHSQIRRELSAQVRRVRDGLGVHELAVDGHQHIQVFPFVFDELCTIAKHEGIVHVRVPEEPLSVSLHSFSLSGLRHLFGAAVVSLFAKLIRRKAYTAAIATNDAFVGLLYSGYMVRETATAGLKAVLGAVSSAKETEILFHPGEATPEELTSWSGSCSWHYHSGRKKEREYVMSTEAQRLFTSFRDGSLEASKDTGKIVRYGISGTLAAFTHLGGLFLLTSVVGVWYVASNIVAYAAGFIVSFTLQKFWTFKSDRLENVHHQLVQYALVQGWGLLANTTLMYLLVEFGHIWYLLAQGVALIAVGVMNFFLFRIIFRHA